MVRGEGEGQQDQHGGCRLGAAFHMKVDGLMAWVL